MKKLNIGTGGHRQYYNDDLSHLNEAIQEAAAALGSMFGSEAVYLTDTVITNTGSNHTCNAGYMVYKGEICRFDAQAIANQSIPYELAWVADVSYRALDPILYADGSSKSPHEIKKVKLAWINTGSFPAGTVWAKSVFRGHIGQWNQATLKNGWTGFLSYRKEGDALAFSGTLDCSSATSGIICTLPIGFRPGINRIGLCIPDVSTNFTVDVQTTGDVEYVSYGTTSIIIVDVLRILL